MMAGHVSEGINRCTPIESFDRECVAIVMQSAASVKPCSSVILRKALATFESQKHPPLGDLNAV